jgi:hypothetical protein
LQLLREGVEPNPGPPYATLTAAIAEKRSPDEERAHHLALMELSSLLSERSGKKRNRTLFVDALLRAPAACERVKLQVTLKEPSGAWSYLRRTRATSALPVPQSSGGLKHSSMQTLRKVPTTLTFHCTGASQRESIATRSTASWRTASPATYLAMLRQSAGFGIASSPSSRIT